MNNYKLKKYKIKYKNSIDINKKKIYQQKINYYLLLKLKNKNLVGGTNENVDNSDSDFYMKLIKKHTKLFPESKKDYDDYFYNIINDKLLNEELKDYLFFNLINKYEFDIIKEPPIYTLQKNKKIYHVSPNILEYPTNTANWFAENLNDIHKFIIPFKFMQNSNLKKLYIYEYEIKENINLIHTNTNYTFVNLETYLSQNNKSYVRSSIFIQNDIDNFLAAEELSKMQNFNGWYEEPSALPAGIMIEIMITGDTKRFLNKTNVSIFET